MADENVLNPEPGKEDIDQVKARLGELETLLTQKETELAEARASLSEKEKAIGESGRMLAEAVSSYRNMVITAHPGVPDELIAGDTVVDINASLDKAKHLVSKVKQGLATETASVKVPAGAPERRLVNLDVLSPREKIKYAVGGRK